MQTKETKTRNNAQTKKEKPCQTVSYRLKCAKTANGLSHFVMYGDVPTEKTLL